MLQYVYRISLDLIFCISYLPLKGMNKTSEANKQTFKRNIYL